MVFVYAGGAIVAEKNQTGIFRGTLKRNNSSKGQGQNPGSLENQSGLKHEIFYFETMSSSAFDPRFPELTRFSENALPVWMRDVHFNSHGLVMAICQDAKQQDILMVAWMNANALWLTNQRGEMVFWSRSRQELWHKGATSGNVLVVESFSLDCDGDALLFQVHVQGHQAACHTGRRSCFYRAFDASAGEWVITSDPLP